MKQKKEAHNSLVAFKMPKKEEKEFKDLSEKLGICFGSLSYMFVKKGLIRLKTVEIEKLENFASRYSQGKASWDKLWWLEEDIKGLPINYKIYIEKMLKQKIKEM